jgi:Lysophospholipase L1 and related esterases
MNLFRPVAALLALALSVTLATAASDKWQKDIDAFIAADAAKPPQPGGVVFVGSSSIRMWKTLADDFAGTHVVNRGFGGSQLADSVHYFDQLVRPHAPRTVVLYAGDNDLWSGKSPETVLADFQAFCAKVHEAFPQARVAYIAIKPSPSRWKIREQMIRTNELIAAECAQDPRRVFIDVFTPMLDADGQPRPEFYIKDMLHMNAAGYAVWTRAVAPVLKP